MHKDKMKNSGEKKKKFSLIAFSSREPLISGFTHLLLCAGVDCTGLGWEEYKSIFFVCRDKACPIPWCLNILTADFQRSRGGWKGSVVVRCVDWLNKPIARWRQGVGRANFSFYFWRVRLLSCIAGCWVDRPATAANLFSKKKDASGL